MIRARAAASVIPAKAGTQYTGHPGAETEHAGVWRNRCPTVIPAQAGTQYTAQQWWGRCFARSGEVPATCLRPGQSRADRMRSARRGVHGSRPVPSDALTGALGAGMTLECAAIVPFECGAIVPFACVAIVPLACGAIVPLACGAIVSRQRHPGEGRDPVHGAGMMGAMSCAIGCLACDQRRRASIACDVHAVTCMGPGLFPGAPSAPG